MEITIKEQSFQIKENCINGLSGSQLENLINIVSLKQKEKIKINHKDLTKKEMIEYKKSIQVIKRRQEYNNYYKSIYDWFYQTLEENNILPKNIDKKIMDAIKIIGLKEDILNQGLLEISESEGKLLQIANALLMNPNIIILEEPFIVLDLNEQKKIIRLLQKLTEKYNKTVIIISNDANMLYLYTDYLILFKNQKKLIEGKTTDVYTKVDVLKKHHIKIPEIVEFSYMVREHKNVKIDYYKDVRDIIKDIYKHVKR